MKIGILTFQFAHNYGAQLQAYALQKYIRSNTNAEVSFIPYYPDHFQVEYEISPFCSNLHIKQRISKALHFHEMKATYNKFERFKENRLNIHQENSDKNIIINIANDNDYCIFGSDQIWNIDIINGDMLYFGEGIVSKKIAYSASNGNKGFTKRQEEIKTLLKDFKKISVREPNLKNEIDTLLGEKVTECVDPVFLLNTEIWKSSFEKKNIGNRYVLLYLLENNEELVRYAQRYAKENNLQILEIYPVRKKQRAGITFVNDIGPEEFLSLISDADCVCTNSFHAVSFCVILKKKCLHIPNRNSPNRTVNLISHLSIRMVPEGEMPLYIFEDADYTKLNKTIQISKKYLNDTFI